MSAVIENTRIEEIVRQWERQIRFQQARPVKCHYPNDIAMIPRYVQDYPATGVSQIVGAFPIYYKDKPEDVFKKYCNVFADEAYQFVNQINAEKKMLVNENGMSLNKTMRIGLSLPENLNAILKGYSTRVLKRPFPSDWWIKQIKEFMPVCFIGEGLKSIKEKDI